MKNLGQMMKQAQAMQTKIQDMQDRLSEMEVEGVSGGGMVSIIMTCKGEVRGVLPNQEWKADEAAESLIEAGLIEPLLIVAIDNAANAPKVAAYLDFFADLYKTMPSGTSQASFGEVLSNFSSDKVGHTAYAGRIIEALERTSPALATKYGITPYMDSAGKAKAVNHGYDGWVVLKTPNSNESMKFMKWFTENQYINFLHTAPLHFQPPRLDVYEDARWRAHPLIEKHKDAVESMKGFIVDKSMVLTSVDTEGPAPDLRPGKVFEGFVIPEMLQNRILKNMPAADCVKAAGDKMRKLTA